MTGEAPSSRSNSANSESLRPLMRPQAFIRIALFLELDGAHLDPQLRGRDLERLPGYRVALIVSRRHLVIEGPGRVIRRNDPSGRPQIVGRSARRVSAKRRVDLLAVLQFYDH